MNHTINVSALIIENWKFSSVLGNRKYYYLFLRFPTCQAQEEQKELTQFTLKIH